MKTKKKNIFRVLIALAVVIVVVYASLPYYARQALIHWMPVIDDLETFHRHTVHHNPDDVWHWPLAADYNRYQLTEHTIWTACTPCPFSSSIVTASSSKVIATDGTTR